MKKIKEHRINVAKLGAVPLRKFEPSDHNEPGTPVAVKLTPMPIPPAVVMMKKNTNSKKKNKKQKMQSPEFDPNGSYTGVPQRPYEKPEQDADDL